MHTQPSLPILISQDHLAFMIVLAGYERGAVFHVIQIEIQVLVREIQSLSRELGFHAPVKSSPLGQSVKLPETQADHYCDGSQDKYSGFQPLAAEQSLKSHGSVGFSLTLSSILLSFLGLGLIGHKAIL
jgi:hypothetical protein